MVRFTQFKNSLLCAAAVSVLVSCGPKRSASFAESRKPESAQASSRALPSAAAQSTTAPVASTEGEEDVSPVPEDEPEVIEDGAELEDDVTSGGEVVPHPFDTWSEAELEQALAHDLSSLGSMSVGTPNAGALVNGVQAEESPLVHLVSPGAAWGTRETLDYLSASLRKVHAEHPHTRPLELGDISIKNGGPLRPHISHQSGRDVDIGFFYNDGQRWYARGTAKNLDLARNWAFVRALIAETDVEMILLDHSIQALLKRYALEIGEDPEWVEAVFRGKSGLRPIIRHARGHATHFHIRFFNPIAQESARRAYALLARHKIITPFRTYLTHRIKKGETLGMIAKKYGTTVRVLKVENGLRSSLIRARGSLRVPAKTGVRVAKDRITIPPRRPPPPRAVQNQASREPKHESPPLSAAGRVR